MNNSVDLLQALYGTERKALLNRKLQRSHPTSCRETWCHQAPQLCKKKTRIEKWECYTVHAKWPLLSFGCRQNPLLLMNKNWKYKTELYLFMFQINFSRTYIEDILLLPLFFTYSFRMQQWQKITRLHLDLAAVSKKSLLTNETWLVYTNSWWSFPKPNNYQFIIDRIYQLGRQKISL